MDFFYQPYLLESLVPHEPYFELDIAILYPDNPSESIHWYASQSHKKILFYNFEIFFYINVFKRIIFYNSIYRVFM